MKRISFATVGGIALICAAASAPTLARNADSRAGSDRPVRARAEVPIRQVRLSNGQTRYAIPITVGGRPVLVGLDTGSVGLRLLPAAQTGLQSTGRPNREPFGSGVVLEGRVARGQVAIGDRSGEIGVQQVLDVSCANGGDKCNARDGIARYRIMGDDLPGEGFFGIIGIKPNLDTIPRNPLIQLGIHRWIVSLPRPGSSRPGALVLDPDARDVTGFRPVPTGARPGQVLACLYRPTPVRARACGNTIMDTGAPGLGVFNATLPARAMPGAPARLVFGDGNAGSPGMLLRLDDRLQMTRYTTAQKPDVQGVQIRTGVTPYLAYDILYDADRGTIAVRPRPPFPGGPVAQP